MGGLQAQDRRWGLGFLDADHVAPSLERLQQAEQGEAALGLIAAPTEAQDLVVHATPDDLMLEGDDEARRAAVAAQIRAGVGRRG